MELVDFHETKYPDTEFTACLLSFEVKPVGDKKTLSLVLAFENLSDDDEPLELAIRGIDKRKDDGTVSDFYQFGKFIKSLRKLGIRPDLTDNRFSTKPNLINKVITMTPIDIREVKSEGGDTPKTYRDWAVTKVEGHTGQPIVGTTKPTKESPAKPTTSPDETYEPFMEFMVENLTDPTNENGIIKLINTKFSKPEDAETRKRFNETRKANLIKGVRENRLTVDETGKYQVV